MRASGFAAANVNGKPASGGDAMPGRKCSPIDRRQKCDTRRHWEATGEMLWHAWHGYLFPCTAPEGEPEAVPAYEWHFCPACGGGLPLGIRQKILLLKRLPREDGGEGEE